MFHFVEGERKPVIYCPNPRVAAVNTGRTILDMGGGAFEVPPTYLEGCLIVETVRHHLDVLVSYWYAQKSSVPFDNFIEEVLNGKNDVFGPEKLYGRYNSNYILRYETLDFEWDVLCLNAGLPSIKIKRTLSTRPKNIKWQSLFNYRLRLAVCDRYKDEMERLGYGVH